MLIIEGCAVAIKETIQGDLVSAQKEKAETKISTLRLLLAAVHNEEIAKKESLSDEEVIQIISREMKRRREAITEYEKAGRHESADQERTELKILEAYGPKQLTEGDLRALIEEKMTEVGGDNTGKLIGAVMQAAKGQTDGQTVRRLVETITKKSGPSD